jgi:hypothetical protein
MKKITLIVLLIATTAYGQSGAQVSAALDVIRTQDKLLEATYENLAGMAIGQDHAVINSHRNRDLGSDYHALDVHAAMIIVWVLLFLPLDELPPGRDSHVYATEAQCEEALADVIARGFARAEELGCERREQKP